MFVLYKEKHTTRRSTVGIWSEVRVSFAGHVYFCDRKSRAACAQSFAPRQQATTEITRRNLSSRMLVIKCNRSHVNVGRAIMSQSLFSLLARVTDIYFRSSCTSPSWWITQSTEHHRRGCNNIPSFLQRTTLIARSLCEGWTRHDLHILVTAPFCCDRNPERHVRKASHCRSKQQQRSCIAISLRVR